MAKTIAIVGFGPGTSTAVAEKFGAEGFSVALIGRNPERLASGVSQLKARGIDASAFSGDAADPESMRAAIRNVRSQFGTVTVIQWNAYGGVGSGDMLAADDAALRSAFDAAVFGLLAATGEALPDLKRDGAGAILVANGALSETSSEADAASIQMNAVGLALSGAAKHKLVGLLAQRLKGEGVYVGEVMVHATIKGTPGENANYAVDPSVIANKYWELYQARSETRADIAVAKA